MIQTVEKAIPEEIADLFLEYRACADCRDNCIRLVFGTKSAIYYAKRSRKALDKAWALVRELYPETASKAVTFNIHKQCIIFEADQPEAA